MSSKRNSTRARREKDINATNISYDTTCIDLNLPRKYVCSRCIIEIDGNLGLGKKKSNEKSDLDIYHRDVDACRYGILVGRKRVQTQ